MTAEKIRDLKALFGLEKKIVVVTGAAVGMGKSSAFLLANHGATVVAADHRSVLLRESVKQMLELGGNVLALEADVRSEASVLALFADVFREFGRCDILVNAATTIVNAPAAELTLEQWDEAHETNLRGTFLCSREAIKLMLAGGVPGRIINITTIGATHPVLFGNAAYGSSKAGVNMLAKNLAMEYAKQGITVNTVMPGAVLTEDTKVYEGRPPRGPGVDPARHLSGFGTADDVAATVLFFASPAARFITGQALAVDGGFQVG